MPGVSFLALLFEPGYHHAAGLASNSVLLLCCNLLFKVNCCPDTKRFCVQDPNLWSPFFDLLFASDPVLTPDLARLFVPL